LSFSDCLPADAQQVQADGQVASELKFINKFGLILATIVNTPQGSIRTPKGSLGENS